MCCCDKFVNPGADEGPVCKRCPLMFSFDPCSVPLGGLKKLGCSFQIWSLFGLRAKNIYRKIRKKIVLFMIFLDFLGHFRGGFIPELFLIWALVFEL